MVSAFINFLSHEKRYSPHTILSYQNDLSQFHTYLKGIYQLSDLAVVKHMHIRSWMVDLVHNDISPRSINRKLSTLRSFYNYLQKQKQVTSNPCLKVTPPKTAKRLPSIIQERSLDELLKPHKGLFPNTFKGAQNRLIIELLYHTGMRRSELIRFKFSNIDQSNRWIKVLGKGNKERIIPISEKLLSLIIDFEEIKKEQMEDIPLDNFLFLTGKGRQLYPKYVYNVVQKYLKMVSTSSKRSPHILRHSFATHLMNNGADLNAVKELLGHSSLAATQVYTHNSIQELKNVYKKAHPKAE